MDVFEVYVNRLGPTHTPEASTSSSDSGETKYQYQRALDLSKSLRDNLYVFSNEQIKQLQTQSVLVQRATATAETISSQASAQYAAAQGKVNALSDTMVAELQSIRVKLIPSTFRYLADKLAGIYRAAPGPSPDVFPYHPGRTLVYDPRLVRHLVF